MMAEDTLNDSFPDLKEVENKVGRKTPESLLTWMRDAADCEEDDLRSDVVDMGDRGSASSDSFSDKISNLKQEMRWLRSADVKILRQLVAVHEGIEAMRWLMEERGALASHSSSLTGSLSSLVTMEESSMSHCRENQSPTQDLTETSGEESAHHPPNTDDGDSHRRSSFDILIPETTEAKPLSPSTSEFEVSPSTYGGHVWAPSSPTNDSVSAELQKSQPQDSARAPLKDFSEGANTIRRALLRSIKSRKKVKAADIVVADNFPLTKQSVEIQAEHRAQQSVEPPQNNTTDEKEEERTPDREMPLLFFDSQWCWVDSQDDVTFV
ncbi:leucine rich adaptor protein 1-like isoform X1 [Sebastes umbrosus]|uniref:leucine rich adaptor protein 1-like isoform X1 n=1 Tax=Sebastes umbrosus TaxID=72105 RepID=UPI00189FE1DC|nr:leucine rich adaptor protein 1-like isoform X1 [Sebastes umbrosus]